MSRRWICAVAVALAVWSAGSLAAGWWVLPGMLLHPPLPRRTEAFRAEVLSQTLCPGSLLTRARIPGGEGRPLDLIHVRRPNPRGAVIYLHGFGDDVWGTLGQAQCLPEFDAVGFTFRGRDLDPGAPCTLGAWERGDVVAAFHYLEEAGFSPERILLAGWSMGAGTALLALADLEREGRMIGGALLECPFKDLERVARDHLRGTLGAWEILALPAERCALWRAGRQAGFDPASVSPLQASRALRSPIALITGDADRETPLDGVRAIAKYHPDLTVVAGAGHCEASQRLPGGWEGWARTRLARWGF